MTHTDLLQLAIDSSGCDPETEDTDLSEAIAVGLFSVIVQAIQEYAQRAPYNTWSELSHDIAEQFEFDWINPTPEQQAYIQAKRLVRSIESANLWGVRDK